MAQGARVFLLQHCTNYSFRCPLPATAAHVVPGWGGRQCQLAPGLPRSCRLSFAAGSYSCLLFPHETTLQYTSLGVSSLRLTFFNFNLHTSKYTITGSGRAGGKTRQAMQ